MKKIIILAILLLFVTPAYTLADVFYVGGNFIIPVGRTDGVGGGAVVGYGREFDQFIVWGQWQETKTGEGLNTNTGLTGISVLSKPFIPFLRSGFFATLEGGVTKVEDRKVEFGSLMNAGLYFNLTDETMLWLGGSYTNATVSPEVALFSVQAGVSMELDW